LKYLTAIMPTVINVEMPTTATLVLVINDILLFW
jgi:hypothetical protein